MRRQLRNGILMTAVCCAAAGCASTSAPSSDSAGPAPSASAPITLALVTSLTGVGATETSSDPAGFLARIDLQNAEGGVNGHKLVPLVIDDQTSPTEITAAVQSALAKGAFGIVSASPLFFLAAKYPQEQGVPVTGSYTDGPEWGERPYTNMFASDLGSLDPAYPVNTLEGKVLKEYGGTVLGSYGYSISPTSSREAASNVQSFEHAGGKLGVLDTSVPFGSVDFTSAALVAKQHGVNALFPTMIDASSYALTQALEQAGVKLKAAVFATGYAPDVVRSPAWSGLQGFEFLSIFRPFSLPDVGTEQMAAALQKYQHFTKSQFPTLFQYETWSGASLMIQGLQMAGPHPTKAAVIKDLRSITNYTANGLLPNPINYSTVFGHDPPQQCVWVLRAEESGFVASKQTVCGTDLNGA
jgi:branched-chain amino acid transport system substrate-binding protein